MTQPQPETTPETAPAVERRTRNVTRVPDRRAGGGQNYSRFVSAMKLLFPLLAGVLLLLIAIWPQIQGGVDQFRFSMTKLDKNDARDLSMVNTRYSGVDRQNRPFTITADVAREKPGATESIALEGPKADLTTNGGVWIALTAENGLYKSFEQTLDLTGNVELLQDRGNSFRTTSVHMDLAAGTAEGKEPISGQGPFGRIEAQGFRVLDKGNTIVFTGKTKLSVEPGAGRARP